MGVKNDNLTWLTKISTNFALQRKFVPANFGVQTLNNEYSHFNE